MAFTVSHESGLGQFARQNSAERRYMIAALLIRFRRHFPYQLASASSPISKDN